MDVGKARRKRQALLRMTVDRGCTEHEARTAARLAAALEGRYGFAPDAATREYRAGFEARYARAEARAAVRFKWEYRRCGKARCHCARASSPAHGPYKYGKRREGRKVRSIYIGRA